MKADQIILLFSPFFLKHFLLSIVYICVSTNVQNSDSLPPVQPGHSAVAAAVASASITAPLTSPLTSPDTTSTGVAPACVVEAKSLPADVAGCHAMIVELLKSLAEHEGKNHRLHHQVQSLLRKLYGRSSEKISDNDMSLFRDIMDQLQPLPEPAPVTEPVAQPETTPSETKNRHKHGRSKPPGDLPHQDIIYDLPEDQKPCPCCGVMRCLIGQDVSEQLDYEPTKIMVIRRIQLKYACKACEQNARGAQIAQAQKPLAPIEKGAAAPGLLAHVVVCKYTDHLPMYRLESILERNGIRLSRSTLCAWAAQVAMALNPLYERMKDLAMQSPVIHTDDTPVDALEPGTGGKHTARFWVYVGDTLHPYTLFDYTPSRKRDGPIAFLGDWSGYLQADAFAGYDGIYLGEAGGKVVEVACWAHARRKFYDARNSDTQASARELGLIRQLYAVEKEADQQSLAAPERAALRQLRATPLLEEFKTWLKASQRENGGHILSKSPMGEAISYALNQWEALCVYTTDGRLNIDNNPAENALRGVAIGRKNWLFVGSDKGGTTAAVLYSILQTCKRHGVEPWAYLRDILTRIPAQPAEKLDELLPDRWQADQIKKKNQDCHQAATAEPVASAPEKAAA